MLLGVDFKPSPSRAEDGKDAIDGTVIYAMMTVWKIQLDFPRHIVRRTYLLNQRIDTHDGIHPFPAHPLVIPIFVPIWRSLLFLRVFEHWYQDNCEPAHQLAFEMLSLLTHAE